jgi:hypothetical protein
MAAAAWVMSDPKRWTLALRSGRLGRMLSRRRGMIGEVPLLVAKQWTDARDYARQHLLARVHRRPGARRPTSRGKSASADVRIASAHRAPPPPTPLTKTSNGRNRPRQIPQLRS